MRRNYICAVATALLVAGCGAGTDPYYGELEDAGWREAAPQMSDAEFEDLAEDMAAEICQHMRDDLLDGMSDAEIAEDLLREIDSVNPGGDLANATLNAILEHRCDAAQPDGLKN